MSAQPLRLSVPAPRRNAPRALTERERSTYTAIADLLCAGDGSVPLPSACPDFSQALDLALATRADAFEEVTAALSEAAAHADSPPKLDPWLRRLNDDQATAFQALSTIAAGAYLMVPQIRDAIGYPGQHRNPFKAEEAVDEIMDGILDPVLERGHFYVPTPGVPRS